MINCLIVDDEQHAIDLLKLHIDKIPLLHVKWSTTSPLEAFQYVQKHRIDLLFLDIHMPELDGMQFLKLLGGKVPVILTTAYSEYALEGYEFSVVDYLLKPVRFERFLSAVQKAMDRQSTATVPMPVAGLDRPPPDNDFLFVKTETRGKIVRISLPEIDYIEGLGNYVSFCLPTGRIITLSTLKDLEEKLPSSHFIRTHHSYLVPIHKITMVEGNEIQVGAHRLPIGEAYRKAFLKAIESRILNQRK
ncbi:LytTR family DNA-binding domain-containing protein [Ravibacter arvi]|uniref:LytTR family DNA-binding domain-containing protein n=1 Tax=Ravibacter arvi TaxID=2051041 RepID=A0ABP8MAF3_9BACT